MLNTSSIVLVVLYLIAVLYIGFRASKKENDEGFLLANRKVGFFVLSATIIASMVGGNSLITSTAFVYKYGIGVMWTAIGALAGTLLLLPFIPKIRQLSEKHQFYTIPDYFQLKFGKIPSMVSASVIFFAFIGYLIIQFVAGGIILSVITGISYTGSILLMGAIVLMYVVAAGFRAVIKTDVFQYIIILFLFLIAAVIFSKSGSISISTPDFMSPGPINILAFVLYGIVVVFISASIWQRIYAGKNTKTVMRSITFSAIFVFILMSLIVMIALSINSQFPDVDPVSALVIGFTELLPSYLQGVGVVVLFAAIMSTLDTMIFIMATSISRDYLSKFEKVSKHDFTLITKLSAVLIGLVGMLLAIIFSDVVDIITAMAGIYFVIFAPLILSFSDKLKPKSVTLCMIGGTASAVLAFILYGISIETALVGFPAAFIFLGIGQIIFRAD